MFKILKRISLPTTVFGKVLRALGAAVGVGASTFIGSGEISYAIVVAATVLVFWITGDLQVAKDFKSIIDQDKK